MNRLLWIAPAVLLAAWLTVGAAHAQPTFSIDVQGPTIGAPDAWTGTAITEGDILSSPVGGPPIGTPAPGPFTTPPGIVVPAPALGLATMPWEVDALSYGHDYLSIDPNAIPDARVVFSVDEFAIGLPGVPVPSVTTEGALGFMEAAADLYRDAGGLSIPAPPAAGANVGYLDGNGLAPFGAPGYALVEPNPPTIATTPDQGDNLDAVDVDTIIKLDDLPGTPVFFSLDAAFGDPLEAGGAMPVNTGSAAANGFVGGDVLVTSAGGPVVYAPAPMLGLDGGFPGVGVDHIPDSDDLDALALIDSDMDGQFTPGIDILLFSVRRGSAVIGTPDSLLTPASVGGGGPPVPIEEGDILIDPWTAAIFAAGGPVPAPAAGTPPGIVIAAEAIGLATARSSGGELNFGDDLDALDIVPEPSSFALAALGLVGLLGFARRRRAA